jgi:hypothetical protein
MLKISNADGEALGRTRRFDYWQLGQIAQAAQNLRRPKKVVEERSHKFASTAQ